MTGNPASDSVLALTGCLIFWGFLIMPGLARAQSTNSPDIVSIAAASDTDEQLFDFDIPAQPLGEALKRYGAVSRQPVLFPSDILADLTSSAVQGRYTRNASLNLLLAGTGLVVERIHTKAGVALALKAGGASESVPRAASLGSMAGYPGLIQARIWEVLCGNTKTRPGKYRSLLRLQVDASGRLQRVRLLGSTGDASRDAAMLEMLQHVRLEQSPPPDMPQPLTLLILPTEANGGSSCRSAMSNGMP